MRRVSDKYIIDYATERGCTNVTIDRRLQSNGARDNKSPVIYMKFTCSCGRDGAKKWKDFSKYPKCRLCMLAENPRVTDAVIKKRVEDNGCEFISVRRLRDDKTRILVTFICECTINTTRTVKECQREVITRGGRCNDCGYARRKETCLQTYKEHGDEIEAKKIITYQGKYGVNSHMQIPGTREKIKITMLERYGVEYSMQNKLLQYKAKNTTIERYGVEYGMQNSIIKEKQAANAYKSKKYVFPSGRPINCQGYEPWAFDKLLLMGYSESDILSDDEISRDNDLPQFWYTMNEQLHRYFPDIYIISEHKFIEVKSTYTSTVNSERLELKMQCVIELGYGIEIWVFDNKKELTVW